MSTFFLLVPLPFFFFFFFFNDTATTEIYTLSLHDALPISERRRWVAAAKPGPVTRRPEEVVQRVAVDHDVAGRLQREHQEYSEGEGELAGPRCRTPQRDRHERSHIWECREADQQAGRDRRSRQERPQTGAPGRFVGL